MVSPAARAIAAWTISGLTRRLDTAHRIAEYRFSRRAATDLEVIAEYTIERFGIERARPHRDEPSTCFAQLADNPRPGRRAEQLSTGLRRYEPRSHVIFYQTTGDQILIVRVLHYRMGVTRHFQFTSGSATFTSPDWQSGIRAAYRSDAFQRNLELAARGREQALQLRFQVETAGKPGATLVRLADRLKSQAVDLKPLIQISPSNPSSAQAVFLGGLCNYSCGHFTRDIIGCAAGDRATVTMVLPVSARK